MKRRAVYLQLEMKRGIKLIPFFIRSFLLLSGVLLLLITLLGLSLYRSQSLSKISVGIVIADNNEKTEVVMRLASGMDSVRSICSFEYLDRTQAEEGIRNGSLGAAILIPEDYYNDVNNGKNTPLQILFPADSSLGGSLFTELIRSAAAMIGTTEAAVYAFDEVSKNHPFALERDKVAYDITNSCTQIMLNREDRFTDELFSAFGSHTLPEYYLGVALIVFSIMFGLSFLSLYHAESPSSERSLRRIGVGGGTVSVCRILVMAFDLFLVLSIISIAGKYLLYRNGLSALKLSLSGIISLFPLALSLAAFFHFLFSFLSRSENGGLVYLAIMFILLFAGGGLLPRAYLPAWLRAFSGLAPAAYWQEYLENALWGKIGASELFPILLFIVVFGVLGAIIERLKVEALEWDKDILNRIEKERGERALADSPEKGATGRDLSKKRKRRFLPFELKLSVKKPAAYLGAAAALLFIYVAGGVAVPNAERSKIGLYSGGGSFSEKLSKLLIDDSEGADDGKAIQKLQFVSVDSEADLINGVQSGSFDSGFVLPYDSGGAVRYLSSTSTVKGLVAKERLFSKEFELLVYELIEKKTTDESVFLDSGENVKEEVLKSFYSIRENGRIFSTDFITLGEDKETAQDSKALTSSSAEGASASVMGICIFAVFLLFGGYRFSGEYLSVSEALTRRERAGLFISHTAVFGLYTSLLIVIFGRLLFGINGGKGVFGFAAGAAVSFLWTCFLSYLMRSEAQYLVAALILISLSLMGLPFLLEMLPGLPILRLIGLVFPAAYF